MQIDPDESRDLNSSGPEPHSPDSHASESRDANDAAARPAGPSQSRAPARRTTPSLSSAHSLSNRLEVGLPTDRTPVLRVVPMPADANQHGDIFGGWIMSQVDIAGGVAAASCARGRVATVAVNSFQFKEPVLIGDLVSFYAEVERIGNTSITCNVVVYAERNPADRQVFKVTEATLTYVATDAQRRPRQVRSL